MVAMQVESVEFKTFDELSTTEQFSRTAVGASSGSAVCRVLDHRNLHELQGISFAWRREAFYCAIRSSSGPDEREFPPASKNFSAEDKRRLSEAAYGELITTFGRLEFPGLGEKASSVVPFARFVKIKFESRSETDTISLERRAWITVVREWNSRLRVSIVFDNWVAMEMPVPKFTELYALKESPLRQCIPALFTSGHGLVLFCGHRGVGKTTGAYALLNEQQEEHSLQRPLTILSEVPEGVVEGATQMSYCHRSRFNFSDAFALTKRGQSELLFIDELRSWETGTAAMDYMLSRKIVVSTLVAESLPAAFQRLWDLGVRPRALASLSLVVIWQRFHPKLCQSCWMDCGHLLAKKIQMAAPWLSGTPKRSPISKHSPCDVCKGSRAIGRVVVTDVVWNDPSSIGAWLRDGAPFSRWPALQISDRASYRAHLASRIISGEIDAATFSPSLLAHE